MEIQLKTEFEYYLANQDALVRKFPGRFLVIKGQEVIGDYGSQAEAVIETQKAHAIGTFLVQQAVPGTNAYTQTFHSRVA